MDIVSNEVIQYQANDPFVKQLLALIAEMRIFAENDETYLKIKDPTKGSIYLLSQEEFSLRLEALINKRFGISMVVDPYISVGGLFSSYNSTLDALTSYEKTIQNLDYNLIDRSDFAELDHRLSKFVDGANKAKKGLANARGTIDLRRAYVTGYLSQLRSILIFNVKPALDSLNNVEIAACITHEIGHVFDYLERHHILVSTNLGIGTMLDLLNGNNIDKAKLVYRQTFTKEDYDNKVLDSTNTIEDFNSLLAMTYFDKFDSSYLSSSYDVTTKEYLADSFATQMGLSVGLSTAISKLVFYNETKLPIAEAQALLSTEVSWLLLSTRRSKFSDMMMGFGHFYRLMFKRETKDIYDDDKDRVIRIKQNVIKAMKTTELRKEDREALLLQIDVIDDVIKILKNQSESWGYRLATFLKPNLRRNRFYKERQQKIEKLLNNDLYIQYEKLKQLGENK